MQSASKFLQFAIAVAAVFAIAPDAQAQSRSPVDASGRPPIQYYPIDNPRPYYPSYVNTRSRVDAAPWWAKPRLAVDAERPSYPTPRSPVDSHKPGGGYGGCAVANVHNSYRLTICDDGRYTVRGAGLSCSGSYSWWSTYGGVRINLRRSPCGSGTDWSGDTIRCSGFVWGRRDLIDKISYGSCVYFPTREAMNEGCRSERISFR